MSAAGWLSGEKDPQIIKKWLRAIARSACFQERSTVNLVITDRQPVR